MLACVVHWPPSGVVRVWREPSTLTRVRGRRLEHVSDLPPDLPRLHTLRTYLQVQLAHVDAAIRHHEQQTRINTPPAVHEPPPWLAEYGIGGERTIVQIHRGDCAMTGNRTRAISEQEARAGVADVGACQYCRPDTALGILG